MALISTNGKYRVSVVTGDLADPNAPSAAAINGGIDVSPLLAALEGFEATENKVNTSLLNDSFEGRAPGTWGFSDNAALIVAEDDADATVLSGLRALENDAVTVVIRVNEPFDQTFAAGDIAMVLPGFLGRVIPANLGVANEIVKWRVPVSVSKAPALNATVAA